VAGVVSPVTEVLFGVVDMVIHSIEVVVLSHFVVVGVLLMVHGSRVVSVVCVVPPVSPVLFFCFVSMMDGGVSVEVRFSPD